MKSFPFNADDNFFHKYEENGICIIILKNHPKNFLLIPSENMAVAIGESNIDDFGLRIINEKQITKARTCVHLYGKNGSESIERKIYLKCDGVTLLTFSFHLAHQLYLESVKKNAFPEGVGIGVFRENFGGGGITYQVIIEESQKEIELLEQQQEVLISIGSENNLLKVDIN